MTHSDMQFHDNEHNFERGFWGNCTNTFGEEVKQWVYAQKMSLKADYYSIDVGGKKILDIGGGPVSLLLKCRNLMLGMVVDPIAYPAWVLERYGMANIAYVQKNAEDFECNGGLFDEVWMYNCLQHCIDPGRIIANAKRAAPVFRVFEWLDFPPHPGHPHMLTEVSLNEWIGATRHVEQLAHNGCYGNSYSGCFAVG